MKNKRRHFFVDKPLQTRFAVYVALILIVVCGISGVGLYYGIWGSVIRSFSDEQIYNEIRMAARIQDYEHSRQVQQPEPELGSLRLFREVDLLSARQREMLAEILESTNKKLLWQALFLIFLVACSSIYLTHKVAGPFVHFRKAFQAAKEGELHTRIHLRKHDEGGAVAAAFNEMIGTFDESVSQLKKIARETPQGDLKKKIETELTRFKTSTD
ncbi:MAG: hypothetical protein COV74_08295 [Candidatus Omnitrophica bacterium CG11_big_fil_rev_8_21_14_0_20_45_26]|uniref:HAMP domain-containing protein n=1 Tax=Candidatus Abzuiibacterium crystallinum TaxID=1974748 RepID=A0A2H0LM20_9BACT|nr:MAG: hypothetical protein COV74_08295 [Candidatus Omnitrophica bacterium CG11_big_fil_rev_8_21_14_0_20_45_26]PIW63661.1 MAG: hypothetical protein COW12_09180 [Candidatus Omnitrophica bacterium CG12_big_fil_rev_8_21_14_0_65_45_16]